MKVLLASCGNPDYRQDTDKELFGCERNKWVTVKTFKEASQQCIDFIERNDLGGGNWNGGIIVEGSKIVARVSYNGRVWEGNEFSSKAKEIIL